MYDATHFAANLRNFRKLRGLTQGQLANALYVTAQNVSKWELGISVPDIHNLCALAKVLQVSVDSLLSVPPENTGPVAMVAVDGSGSKTEFLLFTTDGDVQARLLLPGCGPNAYGMQQTLAVLQAGFDRMASCHLPIRGVYCGISGCGNEGHRQKILGFIGKHYPAVKAEVNSDIYNVIYSVEQPGRCIAAICSTGSIVYAHTGESLHRLGGWGYLFDRGGSLCDIGRDVLCAALAQRDGIGKETGITALVESRLGGTVLDHMNTIYASGKDCIAGFAPLAFEAAASGDPVALEILDSNATRLAELINRAAKQYDCGSEVILSGSLIRNQPVFRQLVLSKLNPSLQPVMNTLPQVLGAAIYCCSLHGQMTQEFRSTLILHYQHQLQQTP